MPEQILPWAGLAVLLLLTLPLRPVRKLVLEVSAWSLRLALIGLLAGGAYLWFRPGDLPAGVSDVLNDFPRLLAMLPERGTPAFGLTAACLVAAVFVPVLAVLDAARKVAGRPVVVPAPVARPAPVVVAAPVPAPVAPPPVVVAEPEPMGVPIMRPIDRRSAAGAIASARPAR